MDLTTLLVAITITVIVFFVTKAMKLNMLIQTVLSLISFTVSVIIHSQWTHNPLVATVTFVSIAILINLVLMLAIGNWLPIFETGFRLRPRKSYALLTLAVILLVAYLIGIVIVALIADSISYPVAVMLVTGGFTITVGILSLLNRVYRSKNIKG